MKLCRSRRTIFAWPLVTGYLAAFALASFGVTATVDTPTSSDPKLVPSLDTINVDEMRADLEFIASDEMEGRDTPSDGLHTVAMYIRARLMRLGLEPGNNGDYFFHYPLACNKVDPNGTRSSLRKGDQSVELKFGFDYFFRSSGAFDGKFAGTLKYAGSGRKEDFAGQDFSGRWALVTNDMRRFNEREKNAREAKALGVIVVPSPSVPFEQHDLFFSSFSQMALSGGVRWPSEPSESKEPFPTVYLSSASFVAMMKLAGIEDATQWNPEAGQTYDVTFDDERKAQGGDGMIQVEDVCGFWPGSDPKLSKDVIIVSAHYDHVGVNKGQVYNGADDNGSGTTGLLALAEALATHGQMRRSVMLIWVSGEEKGLWGSKAWTEKPSLPEGCRPFVDINIDMIGRNDPHQLLITPSSKHEKYNGLSRIASSLSAEEGFPELGSADAYWSRSDQLNFAKLGIPVIFLFSDVHADYHQPTDDVDKIDFDKMRRVTRLVFRVISALQEETVSVQ